MPAAATPNVAFIRPELGAMLPLYTLIRDCIAGDATIKKAGRRYLPQPNPTDTSEENQARYEAYLLRAVFYNVTGRTVDSLVSTVFAKSIEKDIPKELEQVEADATGESLSLSHLARKALAFAIAFSRYGVYVDYPMTDGAVTVAELPDMRPTIHLVAPQHIVNWRLLNIGSQVVLSKVVIAELWPFYDDGFEIKNACQFRVYDLVPDGLGGYKVKMSIWREPQPNVWDGLNVPKRRSYKLAQGYEEIYPTDFNGNFLDRIPFSFGGSENNDSSIDVPLIYDIAALNISHYRNSADYEESCYMMGQPTLWASGLTDTWLKEVLGGTIRLGSWGGVALPEGGQMGLVQAQANTMPAEAMEIKEKQMLALGAKLVENKTVQRTATEATQDEVPNNSILANISKNVSAVMEWALKTAALFTSGNRDIKVIYRLSTDFDVGTFNEQRALIIKEYQAGLITWGEMRTVLRKAGVATEKDDIAKREIDAERAKELEQFAAVAGDPNDPNDDSGNSNNE